MTTLDISGWGSDTPRAGPARWPTVVRQRIASRHRTAASTEPGKMHPNVHVLSGDNVVHRFSL